METRNLEFTGGETDGLPLNNIRWAAIFAGLAVGLGVTLLLMLIGMATGLAVYGSGARPDGESISLAAGLWNTITMFIAALVGGFVAARASGLRRSMDGMLHGVVSWGATMLFFAVLTGAVTGNALSGAFGMATQIPATSRTGPTAGDLLGSLERGDRAATIETLRDRFGLSQDVAGSAADRAQALTGQSGQSASAGTTRTTPEERVNDTARTASAASAWLSVVIFLSLVAGAGGGLLGAGAVRRRAVAGRHGEQRLGRSHTTPGNRIPTGG